MTYIGIRLQKTLNFPLFLCQINSSYLRFRNPLEDLIQPKRPYQKLVRNRVYVLISFQWTSNFDFDFCQKNLRTGYVSYLHTYYIKTFDTTYFIVHTYLFVAAVSSCMVSRVSRCYAKIGY